MAVIAVLVKSRYKLLDITKQNQALTKKPFFYFANQGLLGYCIVAKSWPCNKDIFVDDD